MATQVRLELSNAEALVLFEWLAREGKRKSIPLAHHAEQVVLWNVEAQLEKQLVEILSPNYAALLDAAREMIVEGS